jgi:glutaminyl-peptide cyclotransferase
MSSLQPPALFKSSRAFDMLCAQVAFGPRYPGSPGHRLLLDYIKREFSLYGDDGRTQPFEVPLLGAPAPCENLLGLIKGSSPGRRILIGTHFDTRLIADNEKDPLLYLTPIPGANDGGSGTAVMLEMARILKEKKPPRDVVFAFFDAEDVGRMDGNEFFEGSLYFSQHMGDYRPDEVIILDMVGGQRMCLDVDLNALYFDMYYRMTNREILLKLHAHARRRGHKQFYGPKAEKFKYIGCDHVPFLQNLIPTCVLIDIDYPQWHTQRDLPIHCSADSLQAVGDVVLDYIYDPHIPVLVPPLHEKTAVNEKKEGAEGGMEKV